MRDYVFYERARVCKCEIEVLMLTAVVCFKRIDFTK